MPQIFNLSVRGCSLLLISLMLLATLLFRSVSMAQASGISENFNDVRTLISNGWFERNNSTSGAPPHGPDWGQGNAEQFNEFSAHSQGGSVPRNSYAETNWTRAPFSGDSIISDWLLTPALLLQNGEQVSFYTRSSGCSTVDNPNGSPDRLQVRLSLNGTSTDVGTRPEDLGSFTTLLRDINPTYSPTNDASGVNGYPCSVWAKFTLTISGLSVLTNGRVGFRYYIVDNVRNAYYIGIDDFHYTGNLAGNPSPTPTHSSTPTQPITPTATATATVTASATATLTQTATPTDTLTLTSTPTNTLTPSATLTLTATPTLTLTNTATNTPRPQTIGVFAGGVFYLRNSNSAGAADITTTFGGADMLPVAADWDGDGMDSIGVYDSATSIFYLSNSNTAPAVNYRFMLGNPGDTPIAGRWDNTMSGAGAGVFRPSNGLVYLKRTLTTGNADYTMVLGNPGDSGIAGDWDGNGYASIGVFRPSNTTFYLSNSVASGVVFGDYAFIFGTAASKPLAGDWVGSGQSRVGVFMNSTFYLRNSLTLGTADEMFMFGPTNSLPIAGRWTIGTRPGVIVTAPEATVPPITPVRTATPGNGHYD